MRARTWYRPVPMTAVFATILGMVVCAPWSAAAETQRGEKWQFSIPITFTSGATIDGENGTNFELNDDLGWGFGFGYNMSEHLMLGIDFTWLSANYSANIATDINNDQVPDSLATVSGTLDATNFQFVGQYNFMKSGVTPFVRGNFGWTWVDSNIPSGPTTGACWWDPWYGYICNTWQPTFEDTAFSYGVAAGIRAELNERFFIEGSYNLLWVDINNSDTPSFDGFRLNLGWSY